MKKYLIAHDLGTSGNKASLFSTEGELICSHTEGYEVDFFGDNCAEQDPDDWWNAVKVATHTIMKGIEPEDILGMSFSSQMQACVVVDENGMKLRRAMIWADMRAQKEVKILEDKIGFDRMYELTGHRISASYSIEKLMWIKENEPEIYAKTHKMLLAKDYVICKMTGEFVTDYSEASGTNALELDTFSWSDEILEAAGIDKSKMPTLHNSIDVIGTICPHIAEELGVSKNTAVVCGGGDGPCSAIGAGCIEQDKLFMSLGTSAWIGGTAPKKFLDDEKILFCFAHVIPGMYMPCAAMQAAGSSYSYAKDALCEAEGELAKANGTSVFEYMNELVEQSPAGANGLMFLPYLLGERSPRWNPDTSAAFLGIKPKHRKSDYLRAVLEGVAYNMNVILRTYRKTYHVEEMVLTGGGARGDEFVQILANVLQADLHRLDKVETATSIAAAVMAGVGVGVFEGFEEIKRFVQVEDVIKVQEEQTALYDKQKELFDLAYECMVPFYQKAKDLK